MTMRWLGGRASLLTAGVFAASSAYGLMASAQEPPPPAPPPVGMQPAPVAPVGAPGGVPGYSPPKLEWDKGDPIPPGYRPGTEMRSGWVIAGGVTLGVSWAFGGLIPGIAGLAACDAGSIGGACGAFFGTLLVPAIGPFIAMSILLGAGSGEGVGIGVAILAVDGVVQSAGAAMLIYGIAVPRDVLIRNDKIGKTTVQWGPTPMAMGVTGTGHGLGFRGTF